MRLCAEKGAEVVAADIVEPNSEIRAFLERVSDKVRWRPLDVRQREAFEALVREEAVGQIIHAAAITPDYETEQARMDTVLEVNLVGALNAILAAARAPTVEQFVLLSSSAVYGAPSPGATAPQSEDSHLELGNLYTLTKYSAEILLPRCADLSGKRMAAVRLGSVYGEMERPMVSRGRMSHIGRLRDAQLSGRRVRVAGKAIERDWIYAADVAEAIWALLVSAKWHYSVYNIGAGQPLSFGEIVEAFGHWGLDFVWVDDPRQAEIAMQPQDARAPLDITRLKEDTRLAFAYSPAERLQHYLSKSAGVTR